MTFMPTIDDLPLPPEGRSGWPWTQASDRLPAVMPDGSAWPRISVVMPSYNQAQFVEETLRSVLLQGYPDLEFIAIDGGSTDSSVDLIQKYSPWLAYWVSEPDRGQSHAINNGFKRATGTIFAWLNSDDVFARNALGKLAEAAVEHPEADLIYGDCDAIDRQGGFMFKCEQVRDFDQRWLLEHGNIIAQPSAFFRRSAFEEIGGIDEELHYVMDWDLWLRLGARGRALYIPYLLSYMRIYPEAKSSAGDRVLFAELKHMLGKHGGSGLSDYFEKKLVWDHLPRAFEAFKHEDYAAGREEIEYILANAPQWKEEPRFLAQELADQAWKLAQGAPGDDQAPFVFTRQVCSNLPADASPDKVQKQAQALLHQAYAFLYFERQHGAATRYHAWKAVSNDADLLANRGLWSVVGRSLLLPNKTRSSVDG